MDIGRVSGNLQKKIKAQEWAFHRIQEAFELAAQDETEKMSSVQEILIGSTDYLRRIISPVGGQGGVTVSYLCPYCNGLWWETYKLVVRNLWR